MSIRRRRISTLFRGAGEAVLADLGSVQVRASKVRLSVVHVFGNHSFGFRISQYMISESVIQRLRQAREHAGVTLAEVAEITGYALTTLSSVENGHDQPSKRLLDKWTQALNLSRSWLARGEGEPFEREDSAATSARKELAAPTRSRIRRARERAAELLKELEVLEIEVTECASGQRPRKKGGRRSVS